MLPDEPLQLPKLLGALLALGGVAMICERLLGLQRTRGLLGWAWYRCRRAASAAFLKCAAQGARDPAGAGDDCCLANDFRCSAIALDRIYGRRKSVEVSLECRVDFLSALPRGNRFGAHLFASLLAIATNDCGEATSDLAHHATWRRRVGLGSWRRDIFHLVSPWRVPGARRCVDDFPKRR